MGVVPINVGFAGLGPCWSDLRDKRFRSSRESGMISVFKEAVCRKDD